jgi:hypothetical protein
MRLRHETAASSLRHERIVCVHGGRRWEHLLVPQLLTYTTAFGRAISRTSRRQQVWDGGGVDDDDAARSAGGHAVRQRAAAQGGGDGGGAPLQVGALRQRRQVVGSGVLVVRVGEARGGAGHVKRRRLVLGSLRISRFGVMRGGPAVVGALQLSPDPPSLEVAFNGFIYRLCKHLRKRQTWRL